MRRARSSASHSRAVTKSASVSDSLTTSAWRVGAGRSSRASSTSRIAARWPNRCTMRSSENGTISACCVFQQHQAGFGAADLGDRGRHRARQVRRAGDRDLALRLAGRDRLDQIGIEQQRRALQDRLGDVGLVAGERMHHGRRRVLAAGEHLGERAPHQRRRIVEQHDHGAFGGGAIVVGEIGIQKGARQRAGGFGPIAGGGGAQPMQELTNDHD